MWIASLFTHFKTKRTFAKGNISMRFMGFEPIAESLTRSRQRSQYPSIPRAGPDPTAAGEILPPR